MSFYSRVTAYLKYSKSTYALVSARNIAYPFYWRRNLYPIVILYIVIVKNK